MLGLDLGSRRIGVAVTDSAQTLAIAVRTITRGAERGGDHRAVGELVHEYEAVGVVVGLPLSLDGGQGVAATEVLSEVAELRRELRVVVETVDERLTTRQAAGTLRAAGRSARRQRAVIDETAAAVLLQSWVDRRMAER